MSVFESELGAITSLKHPHVEEFDVWLESVDEEALNEAIEKTFAVGAVMTPQPDVPSETFHGLIELTPDLVAAAEALTNDKANSTRGLATKVEIKTASSWIPNEQRQKGPVRRKREPHFKAWQPKTTHTPILIEILPSAPELKPYACGDEDPRIFESQTAASIRLAKSICARCTSVTVCREEAISAGDFALTQGGMSSVELKSYSKTQ